MNAIRGIALAGVAFAVVGCGVGAPGTSPRGTSWSRHEGMAAMPHVMGAGSGSVVGFRSAEFGLEAVRSTDGISWTAVPVIDPLDRAGVMDIAAGTGEGAAAFVAVGSWTEEAAGLGRAAAWVSDGTTGWKRAPDGPDLGNSGGSGGSSMSAVAWGQEMWVAGGIEWNESSGQDGVIWTSSDGFNWSRATLPDPGLGIMGLVAGGPGFVAVGSSESVDGDAMPGAHSGIWTSVDGTIWARVPDGPIFANALINAVVTGGPGLIAVGSTIDAVDVNGVFVPAIWTSTDGLTWTREATPADPNPWTSVAGTLQGRIMSNLVATPDGFVAVGTEFGLTPMNFHRAAVWTSRDGRAWSRVPQDPVFDGGEDSSLSFGMRAVYLIGDRLIATGETPGGPTVWVSPPEPGKLPGQAGPGATPGGPAAPLPTAEPEPTGPGGAPPTPAPMAPDELGAASFQADVCTTLQRLEQAIGDATGARGPEAKALFDALEARDPDGIIAAAPPVRAHLTATAELLDNWTPWPPGEATHNMLFPFVRHLLNNLEAIEFDAKGGTAPDAGFAALVDAESVTQFAQILEASQEAFSHSPPEWAGC